MRRDDGLVKPIFACSGAYKLWQKIWGGTVSLLIALGALAFLMLVAYRGYSVILFAPVAALGAVLLTNPQAVLPIYSGLFMAKMVVFVQNYFPAFMLGAIFGKVIEISGFAKSIVHSVVNVLGPSRAILSLVTL